MLVCRKHISPSSDLIRWWCLSQCEGEECSGPPCSGLSRHRRSSSICLAAGAWAGQANMDTWCQNNCATGYCPASHCRCQGKSLSVCSSVDQFKKLKKKPIKNRFLNTNGSVSCRRESSHHDNQHNNHNSIYNQYNSTDNNGNDNDDNRTNNDACALHYYYYITKWYKVGIY